MRVTGIAVGRITTLLIGFALILFLKTQPALAHAGHHTTVDRKAHLENLKTSFDRLLQIRKEAERAPRDFQGSDKLVIYTRASRDGRPESLTFAADSFTHLTLRTLEILLEQEGVHVHGPGCKGHGKNVAVVPQSKWNRFVQKSLRFTWEVGPDGFELFKQHGLPYAIYFAVTEAFDHLVAFPVVSVPLCKILQGGYALIANPIRDFTKVCMTRLDGPQIQPLSLNPLTQIKNAQTFADRVSRSVEAVGWRLFHWQQLRATLIASQGVPLATRRKAFEAAAGHLQPIEELLMETPAWGIVATRRDRRTPATQELALEELRGPIRVPKRSVTVAEDIAWISNTEVSTQERVQTALQVRNGLNTVKRQLAEMAGSFFYDDAFTKDGLVHFMRSVSPFSDEGRQRLGVHWGSYVDFWRTKGFLGQLSEAIDIYAALLQTAALSSATPMREYFNDELAFVGQEFWVVFEDMRGLIEPLATSERRVRELQIQGLLDLLIRRLVLLKKGRLPELEVECTLALEALRAH